MKQGTPAGLASIVAAAFVVTGGVAAAQADNVTLYKDQNYAGATFSVRESYPGQNVAAANVGSLNDAASSVSVTGSVRFYRDAGYLGTSIVLTTWYNSLSAIGWNDTISSFQST